MASPRDSVATTCSFASICSIILEEDEEEIATIPTMEHFQRVDYSNSSPKLQADMASNRTAFPALSDGNTSPFTATGTLPLNIERQDATPATHLTLPRPSQIPGPRLIEIGTPRAAVTPKTYFLNKELPITPAIKPVGSLAITPARTSSLPRAVARPVPRTGENAFKPRDFDDGDSILGLPDEQRRSTKYGLGGPTVRFSTDCDKWVMGEEDKEDMDSKGKAGKRKPKTEAEIASSFRTNRTSDAMLASRFNLETAASKRRGTVSTTNVDNKALAKGKVKEKESITPTPHGFKGRMSAMLNRRSFTAPPGSPTPTRTKVPTQVSVGGVNGVHEQPGPVSTRPRRQTTIPRPYPQARGTFSVADPVQARTPVQAKAPAQPQAAVVHPQAPVQALIQAQASAPAQVQVADPDAQFERGLRQVSLAVARYRAIAANAPDTARTERMAQRARLVGLGVVHLADARAARMEILQQLDALAVEEVVAVSDSVAEIDSIGREL